MVDTDKKDPTSPGIARVLRSRQAAQAFYDRLSSWYDLLAESSERAYREQGLRQLDVQPGETVLEVGFGTGSSLLTLARATGPLGRVCGIDLSPGMGRVARARLVGAGLSDRAVLVCGDGATLPYPSCTFDAVFMSFTLELFDTPEIPLVLGECRRVLRDGGRIGTVSLSRERENWVVSLYQWLHEVMPTWVDCRPIYAQRALAHAGFEILDARLDSMWGLPVEIVLARKPSPAW